MLALNVRSRRAPLVRTAVWLLTLVALLYLSPAEQTLGQVVKLVYLHGALVRTGLLAFTVAGILGVIALATGKPWAKQWSRAVGHAALIVWVVYVLSSMVVTYMAWGVAIAWGEPRVRVSAEILLAAGAFWVASTLVRDWRVTAGLNATLALVSWFLVRSAEVVIHPVDPIGGSSSLAIKAFYAGIVLCVVLLASELAVALRWAQGEV